jgi:hypothetical protein
MPARTPAPAPARVLTGVLALAVAAILSLGLATSARAGTVLLASATKQGNDGHAYHWAAPC